MQVVLKIAVVLCLLFSFSSTAFALSSIVVENATPAEVRSFLIENMSRLGKNASIENLTDSSITFIDSPQQEAGRDLPSSAQGGHSLRTPQRAFRLYIYILCGACFIKQHVVKYRHVVKNIFHNSSLLNCIAFLSFRTSSTVNPAPSPCIFRENVSRPTPMISPAV